MSGEVTQDEPTDLGQENDPQPLEEVSLASISNAGEIDEELPSEGIIPEDLASEEVVDEEAIPVMETEGPVDEMKDDEVTEVVEDVVATEAAEDVVVTEAVRDVETGEKKENPLESIGAWFQGLVKGPSPETKELEGNKEASEGDTTDIENPAPSEDLEKAESEPSPTDDVNPEDSVEPLEETSKSILTLESEPETTRGSLREQISDLFGKTKTNAEKTTEDAEKQAPPARKGIHEHVGAFFGNRQRTPKDEAGDGSARNQFGAFFNSSAEKKASDDDDESLKKQGGMRQKVRTFFGTKQKRTLLFAGVIVLVTLLVMTPFIVKEMSALGTYAQSVGQVETFLQAEMIPHPLYQGGLFPSGQIVLRFDIEGRFLVTFRVDGLEQTCERCAWSIVEGDTCHDADSLGNTLYYNQANPALTAFNPFTMCHYSTKFGLSDSSQTVLTGYNMEENENRAIILSDSTGAPLACGIFKKMAHPLTYPKLWANMVNLTSYNQPVEGKVRVDFYPDRAFHVDFEFTGVPPGCSMCLIAIHAGTSCTDAPGEHLWNSNKLRGDPWTFVDGVFYQSDATGTSVDRQGFYLYDGFDYDYHKDRVVIVSDANGNAIACGELKESSHYVWKDTDAAVRNAMEAGTMIHTGPMGISVVDTVNEIENVVSHH